MPNYCSNNITVVSTNSELREILTAFYNEQIDWPLTYGGIHCDAKGFFFSTKNIPTPWSQGYMAELSSSYPTVVFHYIANYEGTNDSHWTCFCYGNDKVINYENIRKQAYKDEVQRFRSATPHSADGIKHRVEIMPDGRVAADGENRFGECNIFSWMNMKQISCGNFHTVGLRKDGTLLACGSNANGQCDVSDIGCRVIDVSCGRYHTAILLDSGKVVIRGNLEQETEDPNVQKEIPLTPEDFPLVEDLRLDKYVIGWEKMNECIEHISAGDELTLKKVSKDGKISFDVLNIREEKIGNFWTGRDKSLSRMLDNVKATVNTVTPLSARRKGSKYATMTIRLDYLVSAGKPSAKKASTIIGDYTQTRVASWPAVSIIKSIFDAVIGVTDDGALYVDGFCPCSKSEICSIMGLE